MPWNAKSLRFEGVDEMLLVGNVLAYGTADVFSISAWVKTTNAAGQTIVAKQGAGTPFGWQLAMGSDGRVFFELIYSWPGTMMSVTASQVIKDGAWHHVVVTWNGNASPGYTGAKLYIDGTLQTLAGYADTLGTYNVATSANLAIGRRDYASDSMPFIGNIDEVAIYSKVLTASEVTWLYNGGLPRDLLVAGAPSILSGWWRMGDGDVFPVISDHSPYLSYTSVKDSSGSGYTGTMTNMEYSDGVLDVSGRNLLSSGSVRFDGVNEYATMGDILNFERTDPFSVSFWVRCPTPPSPASVPISKMTSPSTSRGWAVYLSQDGSVSLALYSDYSASNRLQSYALATLADGAWHHVVIVYDGSSIAANVKFIIDGTLRTTGVSYDTLSATIVGTANLQLGRRDSSTPWYLNGYLDEVAVHGKALSTDEATWVYNSGLPRDLYASGAPSDLLAWWRMGDGDTSPKLRDYGPRAVVSTVNDLSGSNLAGTMTNMEISDLVSDTPGKSAFSMKSVLFEGVNEYVDMGNVLDFERTDSFSFSFWMKTTSTYTYMISKMTGSTTFRGYLVFIEPTSLRFVLRNDAGSGNLIDVYTTQTGYDDGQWHHVVWTYTGTSLASGFKCYVDNVEKLLTVATNNLTATTLNSAVFALAGIPAAGWGWYVGNLDEVSVYNKALSAAEVSWIYNGGTPRDLSASGAPSNLLAWWRMGDEDTHPKLLDSGPSAVLPTVRDLCNDVFTGTTQNMEVGDVVSDVPGGTFAVHSLLFDGINEYVDMGDVLDFERTDPFSFSLWVKWSGSITSMFLSKYTLTSPYPGYQVYGIATGAIRVYLGSSVTANDYIFIVTTATGFNDNNWHHVTVCYTGSSTAAGFSIYVDGVLRPFSVIKDSLASTTLTSAAFRLGGDGSTFHTGNLDEVSVYTKALSQAEVTWIYNGKVPRDLKATGAPSNLVAWWRMGEGAYPGAMQYMETTDLVPDSPFQGAFARRSFLFDGVNEYVTMGDIAALNFEYNVPFSASFWVKSTGTSKCIMSKMLSSGTFRGWQIFTWILGGYLVISFHLRNTIASNEVQVDFVTTIATGTWGHVLFTYNGSAQASGVVCYVNGAPVTPSVVYNTLTATIANTAPFCLGCANGAIDFFSGNLDEVSLYNRKLSATEATWIYNSGVPRDLRGIGAPMDLVGWWRLGESAYPGTTTNMDSTNFMAEAPVPGTFATKSLLFDGVNEYVTMGNVLAYERTQAFSISCWVKTTGTGGYFVCKQTVGSNQYRGYGVAAQASGIPDFWIRSDNATGNAIHIVGTTAINDGLWHHLCATWDGNASPGAAGAKLYVDGLDVSVIDVNNLSATIVSTAPLNIAARNNGADALRSGNIDEVSIYNKTLLPQEVAWIYNGGVPRDLQAPTAPSNLVAWWRLGEAGIPGTMTLMESPDIVSDALGTDQNQSLVTPTVVVSVPGGGVGSNGTDIPIVAQIDPTRYYKMRAQDSGAAPPGYVTWVSTGSPDFAGVGYAGGTPTPIGAMVPGSVVLADEWRNS